MTLRDDILSLLADGPRSQDAIVRQTREEDAELYTHCRLVTRALEQMTSDGALVSEDRGGVLYWRLAEPKRDRLVRAVNVEEAVRICREMNPAAILMDIKMPVMDGFEAMRRIRAFDPAVPIVAVTAFAYDRDRQKAFAAGANEYVAKPLSGEHIRRVLGTLLAGV